MTLPDPEHLYFICGPTASGKSSLALAMAERLNGEIVNADAFQLYRGLEVLTAAPSAADLGRAPHHLYSVLAPATGIDAMGYLKLVAPVVEEIASRSRIAVITGGSGLYLKFLSHGPSPLPPGDAAMRAELDTRPLEDLVKELTRLDPVEAARTDLHNRRYVSRALEVCLISGGLCSSLRDNWEQASASRASRLRGTFISRQREDLHRRIGLRTEAMLTGGAIEEVAALSNVAGTVEKAIGIREIRSLLAGEIDCTQCAELINAATRQYAKRQETWFKREAWLTIERL
jgi:tRNA dimethylallyltransferase